jgi:hypothetical protein
MTAALRNGMILLAGLPLVALSQSSYQGPRPEKPDMLYLLHASNLIPTELSEAKEETRKDKTANVVQGASSPARTPLAEPIFLLESKDLQPEKIDLYAMDVRNGNREVVFSNDPRKRKDDPQPKRLIYTRLATGLYRIEVSEQLDNGEYCLSPAGSQKVFCFQVY